MNTTSASLCNGLDSPQDNSDYSTAYTSVSNHTYWNSAAKSEVNDARRYQRVTVLPIMWSQPIDSQLSRLEMKENEMER